MDKVRAFIGIPMPDEVQESIYREIWPLFSFVRGCHWVPKQNLHLTMSFLGDITMAQVATVRQIMNDIVSTATDLTLQTVGVVFYPSSDRPQVIALEIRLSQELKELHHLLTAEIINKVGLEINATSFSPHITIARVKQNSYYNYFDKVATIPGKHRFKAPAVILYQSILNPGDSEFVPLHEIKIGHEA
ncbi:MAG: RNA 2',3'-cyclic phosphodiesterase [Candidatus Komeilibacteria bacterium]|nr:RNA 2',3'-cyclic phosphodiesterase [Candidatus Komeilibacteria bacterium]